MTELTDRVALVAGASRGIGAAIAVRLAEAGAHVAVGCGRHLGAAEQVAERIRNTGRRAAVISGDLASVGAIFVQDKKPHGPRDMARMCQRPSRHLVNWRSRSGAPSEISRVRKSK